VGDAVSYQLLRLNETGDLNPKLLSTILASTLNTHQFDSGDRQAMLGLSI